MAQKVITKNIHITNVLDISFQTCVSYGEYITRYKGKQSLTLWDVTALCRKSVPAINRHVRKMRDAKLKRTRYENKWSRLEYTSLHCSILWDGAEGSIPFDYVIMQYEFLCRYTHNDIRVQLLIRRPKDSSCMSSGQEAETSLFHWDPLTVMEIHFLSKTNYTQTSWP